MRDRTLALLRPADLAVLTQVNTYHSEAIVSLQRVHNVKRNRTQLWTTSTDHSILTYECKK